MDPWSQVEYALDAANETINFGTRTLAEGDALYETTTLAVVSTDSQVNKNPSVQCLNQNGQVFLVIDNSFRIFSNNCMSLDLFTSVDSQIDSFGVSDDNNLVVLCLNDGSILCLHVPSGGRVVCSASVCDYAMDHLFLSVQSIDINNDTAVFIISTVIGTFYSLEIEHVNEVYMQLHNNEETLNVNYSFELIDSLSIAVPVNRLKYKDNTVYISHIFKRYFAQCGSSIIALDKNGPLVGICKQTNISYDIWDEEELHDFIFLKSLDLSNHRILVLTHCDLEHCSYIQLLSYPEFELVYKLRVSENTYLVQSASDKDEVMFIEGVCGREFDYVRELRLKLITESIPEVKLQRMLRRKCFDEAENFARIFGLSVQPIYKARTEEYVISADFQISNVAEFCGILDKIDDIHFVVQYCLDNVTPTTLRAVEVLLEYANKTLHATLQNNPGEESLLKLRNTILITLHSLDTFKLLRCDDNSLSSAELIERWINFSHSDHLEEMLNYLKNRRINQCSLMFSRLDYNTESLIDRDVIKQTLKLVPFQISLMDLLPLIRNILTYCIESLPDAMPEVIEWLYKSLLRCEMTKQSEWPECALDFGAHVLNLLQVNDAKNLLFQKEHLIKSSLDRFRNMISMLAELLVLKQDFGIKISLSDYFQEPATVLYLLLQTVKLDRIPDFINEFLLTYTHNYKLDFDNIMTQFIKDLIESQKWWEEVVITLLPFIYANELRIGTVLIVLKSADVPWSDTICQLAEDAVNEGHPLSENIKKLEQNTAVKMLVKKYGIEDVIDFGKEEVMFLIRRMLLVSKPELFDDLAIITSRNPELKEECTVLCLYHFTNCGQIEEALKYLKDLDQDMLIRCCKSVLLSAEYFLFCKHTFHELLNHHIEVLNSIEHRLEQTLAPYEFIVYQKAIHNLKNIYTLKIKYGCSEISNISYDLISLLPKLVANITSEVHQHSIGWAEAVGRCEKLAHLLGISKEQCLHEMIQQSANLTGLVYAAKCLLRCDSSCLDMCSMAILIMKHININKSNCLPPTTVTMEFLRPDERIVRNAEVIELLQLANKLAVAAYLKANRLEVQSACEIVHWCSTCFWLRNETSDIGVSWRFTPLFHPETVCFHSDRTLRIIKELFDLFLHCAGARVTLPKYHSVINCKTVILEEQILQAIDSVPEKIHHLQIEGYDITAYQFVTYFKLILNILVTSSNISINVKQKINTNLVTRCISSLLHKIIVSKKIDEQFAFSLFLTHEFHPTKWFTSALKMYKTDVKKINAAATLVCRYLELRGEQYGAYLKLKNRCDWWNKFLHCCVPYNDIFQLNPDEIVKTYLMKSDKLTMKILNEFCSDFSLNVQMFLPWYLRSILLKWQPDIDLETLVTPEKQKTDTAERELFLKCREVISSMDNIAAAVNQLNNAWEEVSYYQYEVYLCILDLLKDLHQKCTNSDKKHLLRFLKTYKRIGKPQQKEREEWLTKFPFSREMDPLCQYRLPYLSAMFTKDVWEIIRPEINLNTYERWFEASSILQLDKNDICTYAIKGTIHSGVLKSDESGWSIRSKHADLLASMQRCASQITSRDIATAVLYQAVYSVSAGVDQVTIAEMCWKHAKQWKKSVSNADSIVDVWTKVERKYLTCFSMHILYTNNLGVDKYLALVGHTEQLIRALYFDDSIIERTTSVGLHYPDINETVSDLAELHSVDIVKLRTSLIMECLQESSEDVDFDATLQHTRCLNPVPNNTNEEHSNQNKLKRAIYICQSPDQETWKDLLYNISFSTLDDTMTMIVTAPNLLMRVKALHCFLAISDLDDLMETTGQTASELGLYLEKLQVLSTLEVLGYALTIEELDQYNKTDLMWKILQTQSLDQRAIRSVAKLSALYDIWIPSIWDKILLGFVHLVMISDLQEWLPKLYKYCYTPGIDCAFVTGWECLITNSFLKLASEQEHYTPAFLMLQSCPIVSKLYKCLVHIFNNYLTKQQYAACAVLIPYVYEQASRNEMIKALQPHSDMRLYEQIKNLGVHGVLNTDHACRILTNSK